MPVNNRLDSLLQRALANNILSSKELGRIKAEVEKDGVTPGEVKQLVDTLADALKSDGIELDTAGRRGRLNRFLASLDAQSPTGLHADAGPSGPDFINALRIRGGGSEGDPTPLTAAELPATTGDGRKVGVADDGRVSLGGNHIALDLSDPSADQVTASLGLARGGNLAGLSDDARGALGDTLVANLAATFPIVGDGDKHAFKRVAATGGQAAALRQVADQLDSGSVDQLIALCAKAPNEMVKAQLLDALGKANTSDAQKAEIAKIEAPADADKLLAAWDKAAGADPQIGHDGAKGPVQDVLLAGLTFCRKPASIENFEKGLQEMKGLNSGDWSQPYDAEEAGHLGKILEAYCLKHGSLGYVFGTFSSDIPKARAEITNKRLTAELLPGLVADPPKLLDVPLTRAQATQIKDQILPGLADKSAAQDFARALNAAAQLDSDAPLSSWGAPPTADQPLSAAEVDLVTRVAAPFVRDKGGTANGMIDTGRLREAVESQVKGIRAELQPRLKSLGDTPPTWGGIEVAPETAALLRQVASDDVRSKMSVTNLDLGLKAIAAKHGGKVTGSAAKIFDEVVTEYKANWPELETFDFNKLERIARFKAEGKDVPLCTINGQPASLAKFYGAVGAAVAGVVDKAPLRHEWMADRYGFRARQSVEILDIFAEQMVRGEGPVAALKQRFPGAEVSVQVTGQDFAHTEFLFAVKQNGRTTLFNQGSDGKLAEHRGRTDPKLFDATLNDDGSFDVQIPQQISTRRYPVQHTYSVGDIVDYEHLDSQATEVRTEGEKFDTRYKVLEGVITGFDAAGNYQLKVTMPDGSEETKTVEWSKLRRANHPHYFSETGSYLRDVTIDLTKDPDLETFLDGAQPIIDRHLPKGETASMTAAELAERQKNCIAELMDYTAERMKYPKKESSNPDDQQYWKLDDLHRFKLGELNKIKRGVCRHQCIAHHLLLQRAGIDSRLASGAANTGSGNYRGLHLWVEVTTADGSRFLSDQTWKDEAIPLWEGAYDTDARRVEIYNRTSDFADRLAS